MGFSTGAEATRFGRARTQLLLIVGADEKREIKSLLMSVEPRSIVVTALKRSRDGKGLIVRLFNAGGGPERPVLKLAQRVSDSVYLSNFVEERICRIKELPQMTGYEILTLWVMQKGR